MRDITCLAVPAWLAELVTHAPVVPLHQVVVRWVPIKTKLVSLAVLAVVLDSPRLGLVLHRAAVALAVQGITCLATPAWLAVLVTLALEVLLHRFHVLSALTSINLGSLYARVVRRVTLLVVLVRPQAVTALHALDTPLFMLGHRVVFAQLLAAMPAITCLMDHASLAMLDSIRARLDNPLAIHAQLATPQRGLVPLQVVVAAPAVQVIT